MTTWLVLIRGVLLLTLLFCTGASAQVLNLADLNTEQIRGLDRARTAILLTGGILEEHGPYLPAGTDALVNDWIGRASPRPS